MAPCAQTCALILHTERIKPWFDSSKLCSYNTVTVSLFFPRKRELCRSIIGALKPAVHFINQFYLNSSKVSSNMEKWQ